MISSRLSIFAIFALGLGLGKVEAATLTVLEGDIMVNRGSGFEHVAGTTEVVSGDQVVGRPGGKGMVTCADGTSTLVDTENVVSVTETGCAPPPEPGMFSAQNTSMLIIGGVVVAGSAALALAASGSGSDTPASP